MSLNAHWRRYVLPDGSVVSAYKTSRERRIPTPLGFDVASPGDYVVQDERGALWVKVGWHFEEFALPLDEGRGNK